MFESRSNAFETIYANPTGNNSLPSYEEIITDGASNNLPNGCSPSTTEPPSYSEAMEKMIKKDIE